MLKVKKTRNKKHRIFIASLPCAVCRLEGSTQAAHIRFRNGGGLGLKPSDEHCVPLCVSCHAEQHLMSEKLWWGDKIEDAKSLAKELYQYTGNKDAALMAIARLF